MPAMELEVGKGKFFRNKGKAKENDPDWSGQVNVDGTIMQMVGWATTSKSGNSYLNLRISEYRERGTANAAKYQSRQPDDVGSQEEVPF